MMPKLREGSMPFSTEIQDLFMEFARVAVISAKPPMSVDYLFERLSFTIEPYGFELKQIYKESSDYYDEDNLGVSHNLMEIALDNVIEGYLTNPNKEPQVMVGFFTTTESSATHQYNILSYWYLNKWSETAYTIENPFRIDLHPDQPPEMSKRGETFNNTQDLVDHWGFQTNELDGEPCSILLATLSAETVKILETFWFGFLNWQTIPERFLED
jgi:hypothetical protein